MVALVGPGQGLQLPQSLYPTQLGNAPADCPTNQVTLNAGDELPVPNGLWAIGLGMYLVLEYLDPVTNIWGMVASGTWQSGLLIIKSDGFNVRIANRLGCPVGGVVIAYGSAYVQASTTISVTGGGGSLWQPIVGGQLATLSITNAGAGYGMAPIVMIPAPPNAANNANGVGGVQASGYAVIASGTVSGFTFTNPGAGYQTAPLATVIPNPLDPNLATGITAATLTFSVVGSGSITGVLCTNPGNALATPSSISLTVSGVGSAGSVNPVMLQTITAASVVGTGLGYGTLGALLTSTGGQWPAGTITNSPEFLGLKARPRPAQINLTVTAGGTLSAQTGTIIDGGLFFQAPNPSVITNPLPAANVTISGATIAFTMGSRPDIAVLQPLGGA